MNPVLIHTLSNGLRVTLRRSDGNVSYIGVLTNAGSREDPPGLDGMAHFVEHTIFKGTPSRKSWNVSNRMEQIGGELNAYTTKEEIMLYTNAPTGYEGRAIELLADLIGNASFPAQDIDLERGVIQEEIHSYDDNAAFAVFDEFDELFFKGNSLAHNILGYHDTVNRISTSDCRDFLTHWFTPGNMVLYCVSPTDPQVCLRLIEKHFGSLVRPLPVSKRVSPVLVPPFDEIRHRDNHQSNVLIGWPVFNANGPRRYALYLMSNLLGGSAMNSRLNRELRERRGLVYTVESSISFYSDAGTFQVYFASESSKVKQCQKLILREIDRLAQSPLSGRSFHNAQRQLCGQLLVSGENRENGAMNLAKSLMRHGKIHDNVYTTERIMETKPEDVLEIARLIISNPLSRLIID